jgi:beta-glucosidase
MATTTYRFPDGFLWGVATSAHQVEGNNVASDFWLYEHLPGSLFAEPSGDACDQWHRYAEDIRLVASLGLDVYRLSIEWARVEPEEGCVSRAALDHYRRVLATCHEHGVRPCVTYHHFTSPRWFAADGGWADDRAVDRFARYAEAVTAHVGDLVHSACTINEPDVPLLLARLGILPPAGARHLPFLVEAARRLGTTPDRLNSYFFGDPLRTRDVMLAAHVKARDVIKGGRGAFPVGITLSVNDDQAVPGGEARRDAIRRELYEPFLEAARADDFVGVQTYSRQRWSADGPLPPEPGVPVLVMGYEYWPEALEATIRYVHGASGVPVLVTENGIGTDDDAQRIDYVRRAVAGVARCLADGIPVLGYFYWSLLDNFEWMLGYAPRFGLVAVDRTTQQRTPKPSARVLAEIARTRTIDVP